jgi:uncharacterized membrane protein
MLTVIAYVSLLVFVTCFIIAIKGPHQLYWISAVGIYVFSFIAGFTFGQFTVGLTFVCLSLAIGYSFRWIKGKADYTLFTAVGIIVGGIIVKFVDDYWTFLPFWALLPKSFFS